MGHPGTLRGMFGLMGRAMQGLAAGCVGLVALEMTSYLDQFLTARPASDSPTKLGRKLADRLGVDLGVGDARRNRASAFGPLAGYTDGLLLGVAWGLVAPARGGTAVGATLLGAGAWFGSNGPLIALGITGPREWTAEDWRTDLIPHAAYGVATAVTLDALRRAARD